MGVWPAPALTRWHPAFFFFSSRRRHTRFDCDWSSDVCSSDLCSLLDDGRLGLIDFGAVGRLDSGLRAALQRLMLAIDRRDPVAMTDALLEVTARPDDLDEQALERSVGALLVRHLASGRAPDATMFADLF